MTAAALSLQAPEASTTNSGAGSSAVYETQKAVSEYLMFHFADNKDLMPYACGPASALDFPRRCVRALRCAALRSAWALLALPLLYSTRLCNPLGSCFVSQRAST
jgi:hypothetical protein